MILDVQVSDTTVAKLYRERDDYVASRPVSTRPSQTPVFQAPDRRKAGEYK